jgi:hypothetical protein
MNKKTIKKISKAIKKICKTYLAFTIIIGVAMASGYFVERALQSIEQKPIEEKIENRESIPTEYWVKSVKNHISKATRIYTRPEDVVYHKKIYKVFEIQPPADTSYEMLIADYIIGGSSDIEYYTYSVIISINNTSDKPLNAIYDTISLIDTKGNEHILSAYNNEDLIGLMPKKQRIGILITFLGKNVEITHLKIYPKATTTDQYSILLSIK